MIANHQNGSDAWGPSTMSALDRSAAYIGQTMHRPVKDYWLPECCPRDRETTFTMVGSRTDNSPGSYFRSDIRTDGTDMR